MSHWRRHLALASGTSGESGGNDCKAATVGETVVALVVAIERRMEEEDEEVRRWWQPAHQRQHCGCNTRQRQPSQWSARMSLALRNVRSRACHGIRVYSEGEARTNSAFEACAIMGVRSVARSSPRDAGMASCGAGAAAEMADRNIRFERGTVECRSRSMSRGRRV